MFDWVMELVCDERSLRFERRLGESAENVTGRSRIECVWLGFFKKNPGRPPFPLSGLCCISLGSLDRGANGLVKVGEAGVTGLNGARSGIWGWMCCWMKRAQSGRVGCSSPGRNSSVVGPVSFGALKAAVLLERRFRALSNSGSGRTLMTKVGRTGPCLRWASIWTWQSATELMGYCCIGSVSSCCRPQSQHSPVMVCTLYG